MRYWPFFLMALLVFGLIGNPFAFSNFDNKIQTSGIEFDLFGSSSGGFAFAQSQEAEREARQAAEQEERERRDAAEQAEREARQAAAEAERAARQAAQEAERGEIITSTAIKKLVIRADVGEGVAEVEVELEFVTPKTDLDEVAQEIVELFSMDRQTIDEQLIISFSDDELGTESGMVTSKQIRAHVDGDQNSSEAEVELNFTVESTDLGVIKDTIVKETQLDLSLLSNMIELQAPLREFASDTEKISEIGEKMRMRGLAIAEKMQQRGLAIAEKMQERGLAIAEKMQQRGLAIAEKVGTQGGPEIAREMSGEGMGIASEMRKMGLDTAQSMAMTGINIGETMSERETIAAVKSEVIIEELEQKIQRLEERIQSLLERLEQGSYHIPENVREDSQKNSFNVSFEGETDSTTESVVGSVFLENVATREDVAKFKVTGGEILVGESVAYDVLFGKARIVKGPASDILMIIAQIIDAEENVSTVRLAIEASELKNNITEGLADFNLGPQSKISNKRIVGGTGQIAEI